MSQVGVLHPWRGGGWGGWGGVMYHNRGKRLRNLHVDATSGDGVHMCVLIRFRDNVERGLPVKERGGGG